jgi:hypothetical protein
MTPPAATPAEGAVLDRRTLNRTLLARQLLLERSDTPAVAVVEGLVGMQAQVPLDPYVGLWSRLTAFDPAAVGDGLLERELVRMTLMRTTLHLVSARDAVRLRPLLQPVVERAFASSPFARRLAGLELGPVLTRGTELVEQEPRSTAELARALGEEWPRYDPTALAYAVRSLVPLVQVTPRGVWGQTLQPKMTTLATWVGGRPAAALSVEHLVRRYLRAFGPASAADVRTWSSLRDLRPVLARLAPELRSYRDEAGRELYDVCDGVFPDPSTPAPVRFLPQFDNLFLSHADRSRVMTDVRWDASFARQGTLFVDGFLGGAWSLGETRGQATLTVELRTRTSPAERRNVKLEAEELLVFAAADAAARKLVVRSA